jgi:methionyl aminopeptidase
VLRSLFSQKPELKSSREIGLMREAGKLVAEALRLCRAMAVPGARTVEIDQAVDALYARHGATPLFKGYPGRVPFPASTCISVNEEVVHGIPSPGRVLKEGDILSVDCGATFKGYVGDMAVTLPVGRIPDKAQRLIDATRGALEEAIRVVGPNVRLSKVSGAIQRYAESRGYSVVKKFVGHGIGRDMHEEPQVPNYVIHPVESFDFVLKPGICLAIEPMVNEGTDDVTTLSNQWTVVTRDRKLSAHFEHTVAVTRDGREVLTLL